MIELSIRKPVAVAVGVIIVVLFGALSLLRVPIQLIPDITKPQITIETSWRGASPHEVEREIVDEQEEQLRGVEGLERITSESFDNMGRIILKFPPGTDLEAALVRVSNRLEQVPEYPEDADKPVILTSNKTDNAMAWFMLRRRGDNRADMDSYFRLADDYIKPQLERVLGVGSANVFGGREQEVQVLIEPEELAARGITVADVLRAIDRENTNVSGGDFTEGKRKYKIRTVGEYQRPEDIGRVVLETRDGRRVYLRDVAEVEIGLKKRDNFVRQRAEPTLAVNSVRKVGANVLETMRDLKVRVAELNAGALRQQGVELLQVYDETDYIYDSIRNVIRNLLVGSVLATCILFLFLRSVWSTLIVALAIPVSVVGSFVLMYFFDRSINVISLAGMSFASGMVVDNAIVSLENIYRLRQEGESRYRAALLGARGVWGAILASTLTTIAVFVPVLFVEERAAQLFQDIALAISCSVGLSLLVSMTVIPTVAAKLLRAEVVRDRAERGLFARLRKGVVAAVAFAIGGTWRKILVVVGTTALSVGLAYAFLPEAEYLPEGNRNLAIGILLPPPGYSIYELSDIGTALEKRITPHFVDADAESATESARRAPGSDGIGIRNFFYVARENSVFMGAIADSPERAAELIPVLQGAVTDLPGLISVVQQASLFERGTSTGRRVDIEITGPDLEELVRIGGAVFGRLMGLFPFSEGHQARPIPSLDLQTPEIHVVPDRERARDLGLDAEELGVIVDTVVDGAKASEFMLDGREVDLRVVGRELDWKWQTQEIDDIPIFTPDGKLVSLGSVSDIRITRGPQQINHIERRRAITIQFVPSSNLPLETAVRRVRDEIVAPLQAAGSIGAEYQIELAGTVDDLYQAFKAFRWNLLLAILITYLLMSALFESFLYPFIILFSVPLAAVGGVLCLDLVHSFVPGVRLDILTMLGFVILVGVVVNNAILIVYQTLQEVREGVETRAAILQSVGSRFRPILMTTLTSGVGMLPLVLFPGAGSELYRGLGSVVVGGLCVATVFTLFLIPALLSLVLDMRRRLGWGESEVERGREVA